MKKSFADILEGLDDRQVKKFSAKLPEWAAAGAEELPSSLALEQCSSTAAALYKASLIGGAGVIVDITGGLGVDCWAFSRIAKKVFYFERNAELAEAVKRNYDALGITNVSIANECISAESVLPDCDLLFADPARRSDTGRKVFLLEDCSPDILTLLPAIWKHTARVLLKLSPMADITMLAERFGPTLREIHVVGLGGECKELLCLLEKDWNSGYTIKVAELESAAGLSFTKNEEKESSVSYTRGIKAGQYLFEPSPALMKSGCFKLLSERFGMEKMSKDTHLYVSGTLPEGLAGLGKLFRIEEVRKLDKTSMKELGKANPHAEVSARGIPMRSEELRDRLGCKSGGSKHIFGCSAQVALPEGVVGVERMLVLCSPVAVHPVGINH